VSDHIHTCKTCRLQVERILSSDAAFFAVRSGVFGDEIEVSSTPEQPLHLTMGQLAEYVDKKLAGTDLQAAEDHLSRCELCAVEANDLRAFAYSMVPELKNEHHPAVGPERSEGFVRRVFGLLPRSFPRLPSLAFGSALAALLLMVGGWLVWNSLKNAATKGESQANVPAVNRIPARSSEDTAAPVIAEINDGDGRIRLDREGRLSGADRLPPACRRMVIDALAGRALEKSPWLAGLSRPAGLLMGGDDQASKFHVTQPVGKVIQSDRPTFSWSQLDGGTKYVVEVYDEKYNLVTAGAPVTVARWTTPTPLRRGRKYSWQVRALTAGQEFRSPRPPEPQAEFRILDQATASELARVQREFGPYHLAVGLLYAQAGLLEEAEREFRSLQESNPGSAPVKRLLDSIQRMRM
jgi:anti-sigma factor RsiW